MRLNNWSIAASYDTARHRLRLLYREQVDHLRAAPVVLRQHASVGVGIDPAFKRRVMGGT